MSVGFRPPGIFSYMIVHFVGRDPIEPIAKLTFVAPVEARQMLDRFEKDLSSDVLRRVPLEETMRAVAKDRVVISPIESHETVQAVHSLSRRLVSRRS